LRGPLTAKGRERLRQSAMKNRPWTFSTGPKTPQGKARAAANGRGKQRGDTSIRQVRAELADVRSLIQEMAAGRRLLASTVDDNG